MCAVGLALHLEQHLGEPGVQAHHVPALDRHLVRLEDPHQRVVADGGALAAEVRVQVDHHRAALHAAGGHVLDAERARAAGGLRRHDVDRARTGRLARPDDIDARAIAVVVDRLRHPVAVGVEQLADVREAVPLRGVLRVEDDRVVADDVGGVRIVHREAVVEVRAPVPHRRAQHGRVATRVEHVAAGIVERQAQAERQPLAHLGDALAHLLRGDQVETTELVVGPELAPVRSLRAPRPSLACRHEPLLPVFRPEQYGAPKAAVAGTDAPISGAEIPAGDS